MNLFYSVFTIKRKQKAAVCPYECVLRVSICVSLIVGTLRTKWKRLDLHGRRGKSAKWKQCTLTLKLSPWGKSWKGRFLVNCCQGKKVPKAAGMLTPFSLLCLFSPCSVKELFQLFWLQFVVFRRTCGIKGIQGITIHIIFGGTGGTVRLICSLIVHFKSLFFFNVLSFIP